MSSSNLFSHILAYRDELVIWLRLYGLRALWDVPVVNLASASRHEVWQILWCYISLDILTLDEA